MELPNMLIKVSSTDENKTDEMNYYFANNKDSNDENDFIVQIKEENYLRDSTAKPLSKNTCRNNKDLLQLSRKLRKCKAELLEKDNHLNMLKSRLTDIENLFGNINAAQNTEHLENRRRNNVAEENRNLIEKHEIRIRQLIQETVESRSEMLRKSNQLDRLQNVKKRDAGSMTDDVCEEESRGVDYLTTPESKNELVRSESGINFVANKTAQQYQLAIAHETITKLEAYRNEALVWRTKSAQLELTVKELILKAEKIETSFVQNVDKQNAEIDRLTMLLAAYSSNSTMRTNDPIDDEPVDEETIGKKLSIASCIAPTTTQCSPIGDCSLQGCTDRKRKLIEENRNLLKKIEEQEKQIEFLECDFDEAKQTLQINQKELLELDTLHGELGDLAEERLSESRAANGALKRLHKEKDNLYKAVSYLEARVQVYRNLILENDLVVHDESKEHWKVGFSDSQYSVLFSKAIQTDLTMQILSVGEEEHSSLKSKLTEVEQIFSQTQNDFSEKFNEIKVNLFLKSQLVEQLTMQLKLSAQDFQATMKAHQTERDENLKKIEFLSGIAERTPILENEVEQAIKEKSQLEIQFKMAEEKYEKNLEKTLASALKKYQQYSEYWRKMVDKIEEEKHGVNKELSMFKKELQIVNLNRQLKETELEQRLAFSIDHVKLLNSKLNCPKRDVQSQAKPKTTNKYVACRPNSHNKHTHIERGDLYDEVRTQLNISKWTIRELREKLSMFQEKAFNRSVPQKRSSHGNILQGFGNKGTCRLSRNRSIDTLLRAATPQPAALLLASSNNDAIDVEIIAKQLKLTRDENAKLKEDLIRVERKLQIDAFNQNKWKNISGVIFREVNYLRKAYSLSEKLRIENGRKADMLKGELELAECQIILLKEMLKKTSRIEIVEVVGRDDAVPALKNAKSVPDLSGELQSIPVKSLQQLDIKQTQTTPLMRKKVVVDDDSRRRVVKNDLNIMLAAFKQHVSISRNTNLELEHRIDELERNLIDARKEANAGNKDWIVFKFLHDALHNYIRNEAEEEKENNNYLRDTTASLMRRSNEHINERTAYYGGSVTTHERRRSR